MLQKEEVYKYFAVAKDVLFLHEAITLVVVELTKNSRTIRNKTIVPKTITYFSNKVWKVVAEDGHIYVVHIGAIESSSDAFMGQNFSSKFPTVGEPFEFNSIVRFAWTRLPHCDVDNVWISEVKDVKHLFDNLYKISGDAKSFTGNPFNLTAYVML